MAAGLLAVVIGTVMIILVHYRPGFFFAKKRQVRAVAGLAIAYGAVLIL